MDSGSGSGGGMSDTREAWGLCKWDNCYYQSWSLMRGRLKRGSWIGRGVLSRRVLMGMVLSKRVLSRRVGGRMRWKRSRQDTNCSHLFHTCSTSLRMNYFHPDTPMNLPLENKNYH